jgi:hypothetical protein
MPTFSTTSNDIFSFLNNPLPSGSNITFTNSDGSSVSVTLGQEPEKKAATG